MDPELQAESPPGPADRPRPDGSDVRGAAPTELAPMAQALARAFYDDPHFAWIVHDDGARLNRLEQAFTAFLRGIWLPLDECYVHQRLIGAAVWMPPGTWRVSLLEQLALAPATIRALKGDSPRLMRGFTYIERKHPHSPPHWYLAMLGVIPAWQGRGFGRALLRPVLERCDREGTAAYLEASTPRNRALYEALGFEVVEEGRYAGSGPPLWRMWREPSTTLTSTKSE